MLLIVSIIALAALLCGCCSLCNFSAGTSKNTFTLNSYTFEKWDMSLKEGSKLTYTVSTNGPALDIYVLDEENYKLLKANTSGWDAIHTDYADPSVTGEFVAPAAGTYYFVVDNYNDQSAIVNADLKW